MKKVVVFLFCFVMIFCVGCFNMSVDRDEGVNMNPRLISLNNSSPTSEIVEQVRSAVVGISNSSLYGTSIGTGVAVADGGYILTNYHVISGNKNFKVYFADRTEASASYVWGDSSLDLAIIKSSKNMPYLSCNVSGSLMAGEDVIAIGTPLALEFKHSVTKGIVSALNRTLEVENDDGSISYMQNLIQHDASINPGNSGGPLINSKGEVVGINTVKVANAEGLGFAIPISVGKSAIDKLKLNANWTSAYMGVFGVDAEVASYKTGEMFAKHKGVAVQQIDEKTKCFSCGLKKGDIITKFNNKPISSVLDLRLALYDCKSGDEISVEYIRDGKNMHCTCVLGDR